MVVDIYGIKMFHPTRTDKASFFLTDSTLSSSLFRAQGTGGVQKKTERGLNFYSIKGKNGGLASGGSRPTIRLDIHPSGGHEIYNWHNGARIHHFMSNERDIGDCEMTIICRINNVKADHVLDHKIRGGDHHSSLPDPIAHFTSCIGIMLPFHATRKGDTRSKTFEKEFAHPVYDQIHSPTLIDSPGVQVNKWVAFKAISIASADYKTCVNESWVDFDPFDFSTNPPTLRNNYQKYATWTDIDGKSTGHYDVACTWAGYTETFRTDNVGLLDFYGYSVRSIQGSLLPGGPPTPTPTPTCPAGQHYNPAVQACVSDAPPPPTGCPTGMHFDATLNKCVSDIPPTTGPPSTDVPPSGGPFIQLNVKFKMNDFIAPRCDNPSG